MENVNFVENIKIVPIRVLHYKLPILGFRIDNFAYLTDVKTIAEDELQKLKGLDLLVMSSLRKTEHISHQNLDEAIELIHKINPKKTYLTHLSHEMGLHDVVEEELEESISIAYDGLEVNI